MPLRHLWRRFVPQLVRRALSPVLNPRLFLVQWQVFRYAKGAILSGPFKGMKFGEQLLGVPMVAGTYELELHEVFHRLATSGFSRILDIGAAEGYYAVGVALWQPRCQVLAYEANPIFHDSIRRLAQNNNVLPRIVIMGSCQLSDLRALGSDLAGSFMIVDVEGYEKELLNPQEVPALKEATILVEVHDCFVPGCDEAIRRRFEASHTISAIRMRDRQPWEYPIKSTLNRLSLMRSAVVQSISDGRSENTRWLLLEPKMVSH